MDLGQIIAWIVGAILLAGLVYFLIRNEKKEKAKRLAELAARRAELVIKYGDETIADNIMNQRIFIGETAEMLTDSLGNPAAKDNQVLKTKTKEPWKYRPTGRNQYRTRITLENDVVVGWDVKDT
jgi:hypothetical protein